MKMETRDFRTMGVLWLIYGFLRLVALAGILVYSGTLALMWGALLARVPNPLAMMTFFHVLLVLVVAWCAVSAFFSFLACATLMRPAAPARMDTIVAALLALPDLPLGVVLGVYTICVLCPRAKAVESHTEHRTPVVLPLAQGSR
jgi:hypothetical protein